MNRRHAAIVLLLAAVLAAWTFGRRGPKVQPAAGPKPVTSADQLYEAGDKPMTIFVRGRAASTGEVEVVSSAIRLSRSRLNQMKQAVLLYLKGPEGMGSLAPKGAVLNQVYLTNAGSAVVDLSVPTDTSFGFYDEAVFASGLVHVLAQNFKEVKRVRLLNAGNESGTLTGHYALGTAESLTAASAQAALPADP